MISIFPKFVGLRALADRKHRLWWLHPVGLTLGVVLPVYVLCCIYADASLNWVGVPNFITPSLAVLGGFSLLMFAAGGAFGASMGANWRTLETVPSERIDRVVLGTLLVALLAYMIFLAPLATHLDALRQFLGGSSDVRFRKLFNQLPGISSFMMAGDVGLSLVSARMVLFPSRPSRLIMVIAYVVLGCTVLRSFLNSERLALIEAVFAISIAPTLWSPKRRQLKKFMPFIAVIGLFALFSTFEFFRSWQYYQSSQGSFFDFALMRFLSYYVTSINNGAGMMTYISPVGAPALSGAWIYKFPLIEALDIFHFDSPAEQFLEHYADPEFNNPGGMFVLMIDYGIAGGAVAMLVYGAIAGLLYKSFVNRGIVGMTLFPCWLAGIADLLRILYWAETRLFTVALTGIVIIVLLHATPYRIPLVARMAAARRQLASVPPIGTVKAAL
jgi:hypothetical protein